MGFDSGGSMGVDELTWAVCGAGRGESTGWNSGDPLEGRVGGCGKKGPNREGDIMGLREEKAARRAERLCKVLGGRPDLI